MSPLIDLSIFKVKLTEQFRLVVPLFPRTTNITVVVPPELPEQILQDAHALPASDLEVERSAFPSAADVSLVLPSKIGVVTAWDFKGTRLQVEFAVLNDTDRLIALRDITVLIGSAEIPDPKLSGYVADAARFKQFVDVTPDVRLPSTSQRMPAVVKPRDSLWVCAEVESPEEIGFGAREHECALVVALNDDRLTRQKFNVHGDPRWAAFIAEMRETAAQEKSAGALGVPITPFS